MLKFTNLNKIYFPKKKLKKGDLMSYYAKVAPYILVYLKDHPVSLKRFPNGVAFKPFFQKESGPDLPTFVKTASIRHTDKTIKYFLIQNPNTLLYLANLGSIELHPYLGTYKNLEKPQYLVMDLDPPPGHFKQAVKVAQNMHELLDDCKIANFCKTSGVKGLHIYIPLGGKYGYEEVKSFALTIAKMVNSRLPDITTLERKPANRKGKVYIDIYQNQKLASVIAPYSARGVQDATVATPLFWNEVNAKLDPSQFTIENVPQRLQKKGDPFKGVLGKGINIKKCLKELHKLQKKIKYVKLKP